MPNTRKPLIVCGECGQPKKHYAHGLCCACYNRNRRAKIRER